MVDFQERDTRRSLGSDGDDEAADAEADEQAPESGESAPESDVSGAENGGDRHLGSGSDGSDDEDAAPIDDHAGKEAEAGNDDDAGNEDEAGHDHHAEDLESVSAAVLTVSSTRSIDEDASGDAIVELLEGAGHSIATRDVVNDDYDGVQSAVDRFVGRGDVDAVVTTGGTGVSPEDVTPEAVRPLFEKELPGFGETFRALSREQIGTRVIATRAVAGIADGVPVFCLPGSEEAVRLGTAEIVEPEVRHLAGLSRPHDAEE
jgi:molybdenum cofactor biosynthesis protein B